MSQILTLDDLNDYTPGTELDDVLGQQIVDGVNAYIETHTGRCFGETKPVTDERHTWGKTSLWLRHMDVVSVEAVTLGWPGQVSSTVNTTSYYLNPLGRLSFFGRSYGGSSGYTDYLAVSYTYGVLNVPEDLKLAALAIAGGAYTWAANGNREVSAVAIGAYRIQYAQKGSLADSNASSDGNINFAILDSYRLRRL